MTCRSRVKSWLSRKEARVTPTFKPFVDGCEERLQSQHINDCAHPALHSVALTLLCGFDCNARFFCELDPHQQAGG